MPGERHPQELLHVFGGGLIRDLLPHGRMDMFWGCLSAGTASGSIVHQKHHHEFSYVYPPSRRVALARRAALAREPRAGEQSGRGSTAQRAIPPPLLDLGHRPVGCGTRRHLRRHAVVRRESPRCQTSCAPDGHALGGGGAQGCASARGLRRGFGGFTGGLRAARLMAGPLWRPAPDVTMRLLCRDFGAKPCRRVGPRGSYVACCVHRVCTA